MRTDVFSGAGDREVVRSIHAECRKRASVIRGSEMTRHVESSSLVHGNIHESTDGKPGRTVRPRHRFGQLLSFVRNICYSWICRITVPCAGRRCARSMNRSAMSAARRISPHLRVSRQPGVSLPWRPRLSTGPGIRLAGGGVSGRASRRGRTMRRSGVERGFPDGLRARTRFWNFRKIR